VTDVISYRYLIGCLAVAALVLGLLELTFRTVLPASEAPYYFYDSQENVMKFDTTRKADGLSTYGSLAEIRGRWHVNADGWLSGRDYAPRPEKPVIAVIGDSYVEALQVDYQNAMPSHLAKKLESSYEIYSFGMSGAELSQYLSMSRYVCRHFKPKVMIFCIIDGDIPGSLLGAGSKPGFLYFSTDAQRVTEVTVPYVASSLKSSFRKIALLSYLILNKGVLDGSATTGASPQDRQTHLSVDEAETDRTIINYAFARIREENPETTVFLVLDAPRKDIYRGTSNDRDRDSRKMLFDYASKYGFHLVDLLPVMSRLYRENGQKFNFDSNDHWNAYGHQVIAEQVYQALIQSRKVPGGE